jgi:hypothetical protein
MSAARLRQIFPGVWIQGKGLLATEAPLTLPIKAFTGHYPLVDEVFFEFLAQDGQICPLHEVSIGQTYELLISQKSGFLRYALGDRVRIDPSPLATPALSFLERAGQISDLTGEKLHESALRQAMEDAGVDFSAFYLVLPQLGRGGQGQYIVLTDAGQGPEASALEAQLLHLHHYALARKLRQLAPLSLYRKPEARNLYLKLRQDRGMKLGDLKDTLLIRDLSLASTILRAFDLSPRDEEP